MDHFWAGFEKQAGLKSMVTNAWAKGVTPFINQVKTEGFKPAASAAFGKIPLVQKYRAAVASPGFKAKKALGYGIIGTGAVGYGVKKVIEDPPMVDSMVPPQPNFAPPTQY